MLPEMLKLRLGALKLRLPAGGPRRFESLRAKLLNLGGVMCSPVRCEKCNKVTWSGCGQHIEEALAPFSEAERCKCDASN